MHPLTQDFTRPEARLTLTIGAYAQRPDVAPKAIFIEGNVEGFRSLTELMALYLNELEDVLPLSTLNFVSSDLTEPFTLRFLYGDQDETITNGFVARSDGQLEWHLTETEASIVATSAHGIGYAYEHLNFDPIDGVSDYAVFCGRVD